MSLPGWVTDAEKDRLLRAVVEAVGDRATVVAGVGTSDTAHSVELARSAVAAGADGLLVVSPYYNKPPQSGLLQHVRMIADATPLPVMLYDIPGRTGVAFESDTLLRAAEHERIVGVKDAKGDLVAASYVMARSDLAFYCGEDMVNLPLVSVGAVGFVSVVAHLAGVRLREMLDAYEAGDVRGALRVHRSLLPVCTGLFRTQGAILVKAALTLQGRPAGPLRSPLPDATEEQISVLRDDLAAGGVKTD